MLMLIIVETEKNSKYSIVYFDEFIQPLDLILPQMSEYIKTFKEKNKLMFLHIEDDKLLEKYKTIWNEIRDLKNIELSAVLVYDGRYIKTKIRTYGDKGYTNFHNLNVPENGVEFESFYNNFC